MHKSFSNEYLSLAEYLSNGGISDALITPKFITVAGNELFLFHVSYERDGRIWGLDIWPNREASFSDICKVPARVDDISIVINGCISDEEPRYEYVLWTQYQSGGLMFSLSGGIIDYNHRGIFNLYNVPLSGIPFNKDSGNIVFFDTETTGLFRDDFFDEVPRLVQLAWIVTNSEGDILKKTSRIVYPDGFSIPDEAIRIHGISNGYACDNGHPLNSVLMDFLSDVFDAHLIVGHNIEYDLGVVLAEMKRCGIGDCLSEKSRFCTMKRSVAICKSLGFKYPTLEELHIKLFGESFPNSHTASYDTEATMKCYWALIKCKG